MITIEDIGPMIEALGPRDDEIQAVVQRSEETWAVRYEDLDVDVEFDPSTGTLELQAEIGEAHRGNRLEIYATLLKYNLMKRETGGVTMALTQGDAVVQMLEVRDGDLDADLLLAVLHNFLTKARILRTYSLTAGGEAPQDADIAPFMIRA